MQASTQQPDIISCSIARTLPGLFRERVARSPRAVAYREWNAGALAWQDYSWAAMARIVRRYRSALGAARVDAGDRVAMQLPNGTDWVALDIAAMASGLITVPLYGSDSRENVVHIVANSGARLLVLDTWEQWAALAPLVSQLPGLRQVWLRQASKTGAEAGGRPAVVPLAEALSSAVEEIHGPDPAPDATATLIYTSGTTGPPKGVMLSHKAILWNAAAATRFIAPLRSDVFLSFLPLAHAFERTVGYYLPMMGGSTVAYARSVDTLRDDLMTIRPTVLLAVPRVYERIEEGIRRQSDRNPILAALVRLVADTGWQMREARRHGGPAPSLVRRLLWPLLDRFVARRVLRALGGRMRVAVSGGASLSPDTARFLVGLGLPLVEGYGLTEAAPIVTATGLSEIVPGSAGRPLHGLDIKLGDRDELLVRSPSVMQGYWQNEAATAATIDADGWLRTGDVAEIRDGRVFIVGRLGERLVLSTGEKVMASAVEAAIRRDPLFDQVCVVGEGRPCLTAVISMSPSRWPATAAKLGVEVKTPEAASDALLSRIGELLSGFPRYAQIRAVHPVLEPWTIEEGLLTPTLKIRRQAIEARYASEIEALYRSLKEARSVDNARRRGGAGAP